MTYYSPISSYTGCKRKPFIKNMTFSPLPSEFPFYRRNNVLIFFNSVIVECCEVVFPACLAVGRPHRSGMIPTCQSKQAVAPQES
jgi:hypothetical protein